MIRKIHDYLKIMRIEEINKVENGKEIKEKQK